MHDGFSFGESCSGGLEVGCGGEREVPQATEHVESWWKVGPGTRDYGSQVLTVGAWGYKL